MTYSTLILGINSFMMALCLCAMPTSRAAADDQTKDPRSTIPVEKDRGRHDGFIALAKAGGIDLLFMGDSITDGWRSGGKAIWDKYFLPLKAENFGIGGDRTEHVIWRLQHGELEGIQPKVVVLMIGTNNADDSAEDVALGIKVIIQDIEERSPSSKILLLAIFPRGEKPAGREKNEKANKIISGYADARKVVYLDIGHSFLTNDGTLSADIMPDFLHPNAKGYQIWADAIIDVVKQMMQYDPSQLAPSFLKPSAIPKVAKLEEAMSAGKVGPSIRQLQKLCDDKNDKVSDAAKASMAVVTAWKDDLDATIAHLQQEGDVVQAADLAAGMALSYAPDQAGKAYHNQYLELKKDPGYTVGRDFQKQILVIPFADRKDPRFAKLVAAFAKKYPDSFYTKLAQTLVQHE